MAINDKPELIYCAGQGEKFAKIAIEHGFTYGARLPCTVHFPIGFADQDWKKLPTLAKYVEAVAKHKPQMATVVDLEKPFQLPMVLEWAETVAMYVQTVIIIPKFIGAIKLLPRVIGGKEVRLGYSVPTRYGGTAVPYSEFDGWPVHLLGGSPFAQKKLTKYIEHIVSLDGNYAMLLAEKFCMFLSLEKIWYAKSKHWPRLREANGGVNWGNANNGEKADAPYEAFRRSCLAIKELWQI